MGKDSYQLSAISSQLKPQSHRALKHLLLCEGIPLIADSRVSL
jgi:hypothetical protein